MSDARDRRHDVAIRLELLRQKHGAVEQTSDGADIEPSWGPVGSLARAHMDPTAYAYLLALHNDMLATERARKAPEMDDPPTGSAPQPQAQELPATPINTV